jgi:sugar lactone lactonase YvrE
MKRLHLRMGFVCVLLTVLFVAPMVTLAQATPEATGSGARTFALPGDNVFPEGVAHLDGSNEFYAGSTTDGTIFRGDLTTGEVEVFSPGGSDGRVAAVGMKVDERGRLVVVGGPTGLVFAYDTTTGALITQASTGATGEQFLNDVVITSSGDAYITDSMQPVLYRLPATSDSSTPAAGGTLEPFLDFTGTALQYVEGFNLNGIVASADGQYLLVVQTNTGGLYRIDVTTKAVQQVDLAGGMLMGGDGMLMGGDGMVLDGTTLYVVNIGKVTVVSLSEDLTSGTLRGDFTDPSFSSPTTAAKEGSCLLVVNSQFANQGGTPQLPFTVSEVPIPSIGEMATPSASGC